MLVLFDHQGTPVPICPFLTGHIVKTAAEQGWSTLSNGNLLNAAEAAGFEILVTTDKNFTYQQNLQGRKIAIVVLGNQQWPVCCVFMFEPSWTRCTPSCPEATFSWRYQPNRNLR